MALAAETLLNIARLETILLEASEKSRNLGRPVLASFTERTGETSLPAFFEQARRLDGTAFYWSRPDINFAMAGAGEAFTIYGKGEGRFEQAAQSWQNLLKDAVLENEEDVWGSGPALMGGFSFDPRHSASEIWHDFPDGALLLPRLQLTHSAGHYHLTLNALLQPESNPFEEASALSHLFAQLSERRAFISEINGEPLKQRELLPAVVWKETVRQTAADIAAGKFRKVVLARAVTVSSDSEFVVERALQRLEENYPGAIVFAINRGESCFCGATPERLVRLHSGVVQTMALAGSMARGSTPQEDEELGAKLFNSAKDRVEHAVVVQMIREAFATVCDEVEAPSEPQLLKLKNVQHLHTPVTGRLMEDKSILQLVEQLHPTPAVGGMPLQPALKAIREREQLDRGWYAAPVGWLDRRCEGEFAVALRSALIKGREATLFAGCGIMGNSNPEAEYAESSLKMRVMLSTLEK